MNFNVNNFMLGAKKENICLLFYFIVFQTFLFAEIIQILRNVVFLDSIPSVFSHNSLKGSKIFHKTSYDTRCPSAIRNIWMLPVEKTHFYIIWYEKYELEEIWISIKLNLILFDTSVLESCFGNLFGCQRYCQEIEYFWNFWKISIKLNR